MRFPTILLALLALALPATAGAAAPRFLPPVKERLSDATSVERTCAARMLRARKQGVDRASYRAPMSGFVNVRMSGKRRPDWDLAVFDAKTKRLLTSSQAFGSRELAQTWVDSGQRLAIQGCRRSGRRRAVPVSVQLVDVRCAQEPGDAAARAGRRQDRRRPPSPREPRARRDAPDPQRQGRRDRERREAAQPARQGRIQLQDADLRHERALRREPRRGPRVRPPRRQVEPARAGAPPTAASSPTRRT